MAYVEIGNGYELTVSAACVIGGVSIGGGIGDGHLRENLACVRERLVELLRRGELRIQRRGISACRPRDRGGKRSQGEAGQPAQGPRRATGPRERGRRMTGAPSGAGAGQAGSSGGWGGGPARQAGAGGG